MPEGVRLADRHSDPYSWAMAQAALVRHGGASLKGDDLDPGLDIEQLVTTINAARPRS